MPTTPARRLALTKPYRDLLHRVSARGIEWRIEPGSRHFKLMIGGRFRSILPHVPKSISRCVETTRCQIRRRLRSTGENPGKEEDIITVKTTTEDLAHVAAMQWDKRIDNYVRETGFPRSLFIADSGQVVGTWIMGNDYRVRSAYYGGYPAGYLRRIRALFPEKRRVLHLFSGKVDLQAFPGDTVDINPALEPTYVDDAQGLERVPLENYDLVLADPPYSIEDAERYQATMVKRNLVMRALQRLSPGAHVVWLDQVLPMYRKDAFVLEAVIGMVKSTNHRFRVITIFRRLA
jgi:hypothetical protein